MENLLEMVKNDRNAREFLHECYMEDPDHVGTGFSRWLAENEDVLPVYLECMTQIDGSTGSMLESFVLARMEDGEGKAGSKNENVAYMQEATRKLYFNKKDEEKLETDEGYKAVFEIVKNLISEIVDKSIKGEEIVLGSRSDSAKFHDFLTMIDRLAILNRNTVDSISYKIIKEIQNNDSARVSMVNMFGDRRNSLLPFSLGIINYIQKYAKTDSAHHKSIWNIIESGKSGSNVETDINEFAKYAFLNAIGPYTGDNGSISEITNILTNVLSDYEEREEKTREVVSKLVETYRDPSSPVEMVNKVAEELNVRENYPEARTAANGIFRWMNEYPSADDASIEKACNKYIKNSLRNSYVDKIENAINNSDVLNENEKRIAVENMKSKNGLMFNTATFTKSIDTFKKNPEELATKLLFRTGYKVKRDTAAEETVWKEMGTDKHVELSTATEKIINDIIKGFLTMKTRLESLVTGGFIQSLLEEYEKGKDEIGMNQIISNTEYDAPCLSDNFGNAIMTYVFGIGRQNDTLGHGRLDSCIKESVMEYRLNPESDLIKNVYNHMLNTINSAVHGTENAVRKIGLLKKSGNLFTDFDLAWGEDPVAYIYMFQKAGLRA